MSSINKTPDMSAYIVNLNAVNPLSPSIPTQTPATDSTAAVTSTQPKVNLFDSSTYQTQSQVTLSDGGVITLPSLSTEESSQAQALFSRVAPEHHAALNAASSTLGAALMASGTNSITSGSSKLASSSASGTLTVSQASPDVASAVANASTVYSASTSTAYGSSSGGTTYDDTVQAVAYMGVLGLQNELGTYAQGMQTTQNQENTLRADASELQTSVSSWGSDPTATQSFSWHEVDSSGNLVSKSGDLTEAQAQAALDNVNSALSSYSDQTQLQTIQLQNMSQNYQNGISTISNLMKAAYDTTKNTLGNIHY